MQTNETQRCVALVPAFLTVAARRGSPLDLIELGPSAGLNLVFDRYGYRYAEGTFGDPDAQLRFEAVERGRVPAALLETPIEVHSRVGIDLSPIDVTNPDDVVLLKSFIWPGLDERVARLDAAIETFLTTPNRPTLIQGDYVDLLPGLLADRAEDRLTVVYQTASTGYLTPERYAELRRSLEHAAADGRPLALVSSRRHDETETETEDGFELAIRVWPEAERLRGARRLPRQLDRLARPRDQLEGQPEAQARARAAAEEGARRDRAVRLRGRGSLRRRPRGGHRAGRAPDRRRERRGRAARGRLDAAAPATRDRRVSAG